MLVVLIKGSGGFVDQQDRGVVHHGHGESGTHHFTLSQLPGVGHGPMGEPEFGQQIPHTPAVVAADESRGELNVLGQGQVRT